MSAFNDRHIRSPFASEVNWIIRLRKSLCIIVSSNDPGEGFLFNISRWDGIRESCSRKKEKKRERNRCTFFFIPCETRGRRSVREKERLSKNRRIRIYNLSLFLLLERERVPMKEGRRRRGEEERKWARAGGQVFLSLSLSLSWGGGCTAHYIGGTAHLDGRSTKCHSLDDISFRERWGRALVEEREIPSFSCSFISIFFFLTFFFKTPLSSFSSCWLVFSSRRVPLGQVHGRWKDPDEHLGPFSTYTHTNPPPPPPANTHTHTGCGTLCAALFYSFLLLLLLLLSFILLHSFILSKKNER